jgi:hypothetical protein
MRVTHAAYLQLVGLPTFQAWNFQVVSGTIVALILVVDPMFFRPFCSQKVFSIIWLFQNFLHYNSIPMETYFP